MASGLSNYLKAKLIDHALGNTSYTAPATVYYAIFTAAPTDAGGGTEATYTSYARVAVTNNTTNFPAATVADPSVKSNGTSITFPTNTGTQQTMVAGGAYDASTGGNLLFWGDMATLIIANGATPTWQTGDIDINWS